MRLLGNPAPGRYSEPVDRTIPTVRAGSRRGPWEIQRGGVGPGAGAKHSGPTLPDRDPRLPLISVRLW